MLRAGFAKHPSPELGIASTEEHRLATTSFKLRSAAEEGFSSLQQVKSGSMIVIRPVRVEEIPAAKRVILTVAYNIFGFDGTLEDSIRHFEASGEFKDMEDVQAHYFEAGGLFLVALNGEQVIGSGALRKLSDDTAELKRMWLLEAYHGQGIGYRLLMQLFDFAREQEYARIRLQTSPEQVRALNFYRRVGFYEIPCYNEDLSEISMEIELL
jgi:putative acetyltransferase